MNWPEGKQREQFDREMDEEFRFHLEQRSAELQRTGMSNEEALRKARLEFGSIDKHKEAGRGVWFSRTLHDLATDSKYGLRMLVKSPAFSIAAILTLALGIGATTAIFSLVYGVLYRPLPFPNAERIAMVYVHFSPQNNPRGNMSLADFVDWRNSNRSFEKVAAFTPARFVVAGSGTSEQVAGTAVTADFFSVLGTPPLRGRTFDTGDDSPASTNFVVISESLWRRRFNGDENTVGKVIEVNGQPATIIGIVAGAFGVPAGNIEIWKNQQVDPRRRGPFLFRGIGLLKPGATPQAAQAETDGIGRIIERDNPTGYSHLSMPVEPLRSALTFRVRSALWVIFASVAAVLLIATVNIANLLLAKAATRRHEMAVRISLGAGRERLVRQMLTESVLLALVGGGAGIVVAYWVIQILKASDTTGLPLTYQISMNGWVLGFSLTLAILTGVLFGLVPALQSYQTDVADSLKTGKAGGQGHRAKNLGRAALVVSEVALSFVLLVAAGLLFRSLVRLQQVDAGFNEPGKNVLTMQVSPKPVRGSGKDPAADQRRTVQFYRSVLERLARLPEVKSAAVSDSLPPNQVGEDDTFMIIGQPWSDRAFPSTTTPKVSADYFRALGIPLIRGRFFTPNDTETSPPVTIISESLAKRYFPNQDPIRQKIVQSGPGAGNPPMEIVGEVGDVKYWGLNNDNDTAYYQVYTQNSGPGMFLLVNPGASAGSLAREVEAAIREIDKEAVIRGTSTLDVLMDASVNQPRFRTTLLVSFASLALLLAAIGIYGVMAYSVSQRTRELGIRLALGAPRANVLSLVLRHGAMLTAAGIVIGLALSLATNRVLSEFLFGIRPADPVTLVGGSALLGVVALVASLSPALRAVNIHPVEALRSE